MQFNFDFTAPIDVQSSGQTLGAPQNGAVGHSQRGQTGGQGLRDLKLRGLVVHRDGGQRKDPENNRQVRTVKPKTPKPESNTCKLKFCLSISVNKARSSCRRHQTHPDPAPRLMSGSALSAPGPRPAADCSWPTSPWTLPRPTSGHLAPFGELESLPFIP
jgi:hypothetical protein